MEKHHKHYEYTHCSQEGSAQNYSQELLKRNGKYELNIFKSILQLSFGAEVENTLRKST